MGFLNNGGKFKIAAMVLAASNLVLLRGIKIDRTIPPPGRTKVVYSLNSHPNLEIIALLQHSNNFAYFAVYTLTRSDLTDALIAAKLRGLDVRGILDASQSTLEQEKPLIKKLQKYGIPLEIPQKKDESLMHAKFVVTDAGYASGSYNWTTAATSYNDEVLEIGSEPEIKKQYLQIFQTMENKYK